MALPEFTTDLNIIQKLDDEPNDIGGLTAAELKAKFDESGLVIKKWLNETLLPALIAANLGYSSSDTIEAENIQAAIEYVRAHGSAETKALQDAVADDLATLSTQITIKYDALSNQVSVNYDTLTDKMDENYKSLHNEITQVVVGVIPDGSISRQKLAEDVINLITSLQNDLSDAQDKLEELDAREVVIDPATQAADGLMSKEDKAKLDGIADNATRVLVDTELSEESANAIENKAVYAAIQSALQALTEGLSGKANSTHTHTKSDITDLVIDAAPTADSTNPVSSGGVYSAVEEVKDAAQDAVDEYASSWGEIAMRNIGEILAVRAHSGEHLTHEGIIADAFQDTSLMDTYSGGLLFLNKRLELAAVQAASGTVSFSGATDFNASIISKEIITEKVWADIFTFRPEGYCVATKLTLKTGSSTSTGTPAHMKLSIWKGSTKLCETAMGVINHYSDATESAAEYTINQALDPNFTYTMKLWIENKTMYSATLSYVKFDVTPSSYNTGMATCSGISLLSGAKRVIVLVHATAAVPTVSVRFASSGSFTTLFNPSISDTKLPDGTACKLREYAANAPDGAQTVQVRLSVSGSSCKIYDYALIQLP